MPLDFGMAEREGFEPPVRANVQLISSQPHSTTLPPLQFESCGGSGSVPRLLLLMRTDSGLRISCRSGGQGRVL